MQLTLITAHNDDIALRPMFRHIESVVTNNSGSGFCMEIDADDLINVGPSSNATETSLQSRRSAEKGRRLSYTDQRSVLNQLVSGSENRGE